MSEPAPPPYIVRDRCAACFAVLAHAPLGGRYACTCWPPNSFRHLRGSYWSEVEPEGGPTLGAVLYSKHGRPPLHFYGHKP